MTKLKKQREGALAKNGYPPMKNSIISNKSRLDSYISPYSQKRLSPSPKRTVVYGNSKSPARPAKGITPFVKEQPPATRVSESLKSSMKEKEQQVEKFIQKKMELGILDRMKQALFGEEQQI